MGIEKQPENNPTNKQKQVIHTKANKIDFQGKNDNVALHFPNNQHV
jgi:hypothetical protein